jgi:hypothetical protein
MILRRHAGCRDKPLLPLRVVSVSRFAVLPCVVCACLGATRSRASPTSSPGVGEKTQISTFGS